MTFFVQGLAYATYKGLDFVLLERMQMGHNKYVLSMALLRFISGSMEILVGMLMIKWNDINKALIINTSLAFVGPVVLIFTTSIGLLGISDKVSFTKLLWIFTGIAFILIGIRK